MTIEKVLQEYKNQMLYLHYHMCDIRNVLLDQDIIQIPNALSAFALLCVEQNR